MDPTLFNNLLASLRDTIFGVLTQNGTPFAQLGLNIFRTITIVMIVIAGTRIAFSDNHSLHKLRTLAGLILIVWIMLTLYTRSSPLLGGYSFSEAIPRSAFGMADLVGTTTQQQMIAKLDQIISGLSDMSSFSLLHVRDFMTYLIITLLVALLELAMYRHRLWLSRTRGRARHRARSYSFHDRAQAGLPVLELAQGPHQIQLLSGHRKYRLAWNLPAHAFHPEHHAAHSGADRYHDYPDTYLDYRVRRRPLRHLQNSQPSW
jgi:hypothetical protein